MVEIPKFEDWQHPFVKNLYTACIKLLCDRPEKSIPWQVYALGHCIGEVRDAALSLRDGESAEKALSQFLKILGIPNKLA